MSVIFIYSLIEYYLLGSVQGSKLKKQSENLQKESITEK